MKMMMIDWWRTVWLFTEKQMKNSMIFVESVSLIWYCSKNRCFSVCWWTISMVKLWKSKSKEASQIDMFELLIKTNTEDIVMCWMGLAIASHAFVFTRSLGVSRNRNEGFATDSFWPSLVFCVHHSQVPSLSQHSRNQNSTSDLANWRRIAVFVEFHCLVWLYDSWSEQWLVLSGVCNRLNLGSQH